MDNKKQTNVLNSIKELNNLLGLPEPFHPFATINDYNSITTDAFKLTEGKQLNFYSISYRENSQNGNSELSFIPPMQHLTLGGDEKDTFKGMTLVIHPIFLNGFPLAKAIRSCSFFNYRENETLQLSAKGKDVVLEIFENIQKDLEQYDDDQSQIIMLNQTELLLNYSRRFYNNQFSEIDSLKNNLLDRVRTLVESYDGTKKGMLSLEFLSNELGISAPYLSDFLQCLTGLDGIIYVYDILTERAKKCIIANEDLSIAEIANMLGFESTLLFTRMLRKNTGYTPLEIRELYGDRNRPHSIRKIHRICNKYLNCR